MPSTITQTLATAPDIALTVVNPRCAQIPALAEAIIAGAFNVRLPQYSACAGETDAGRNFEHTLTQ